MTALALAAQTSTHLSEVGYLLLIIAGVWLFLAEALPEKWRRFRIAVSGLLIAAAGVLLVVATHYGPLR